jgi:hypothetical protein
MLEPFVQMAMVLVNGQAHNVLQQVYLLLAVTVYLLILVA